VLLAGRDPAAWEVAARLAAGRQVPLQVADIPGARQLLDAARRCGLQAAPLADGTATVIVCGPESSIHPSGTPTIVTVVPGGARRQHGLAERAARLPVPNHSQLIEERS
jgi:hypothetical protein